MPSIVEDVSIGELGKLQTVPDSFNWKTTTNDVVFTPSNTIKESIPIIDLSDPEVNNLIGNATKTWGAFLLSNHGIDQTLLDDLESLSKTLFELPSEKKLETKSAVVGLNGYGEARISPFFQKKMWTEGFTIIDDSYRDQFLTLWPHNHSKYCGIIEKYVGEMQTLANKLLSLMLGSLGVTVEDIEWANEANKSDSFIGRGAIRLNHYPVCPEPEGAMGLGAHTDSTILTILYQSNTGGLEIFKKETGWVTVEPVPGTLVINVGDLLHILSNGKLPSVIHQARVNTTRSRFSIPYLWGPASDMKLAPIPKIVGLGKSLYRPVTWMEYLKLKYEVFDKALDTIRIEYPTN